MSSEVLMPLVMIGGGGHASVLVDLLRHQNRTILAVISPDDTSTRPAFDGIPRLSNDEDISQFSPDDVRLVNGIGMMPKSPLRKKVNQRFLDLGYQFETVISEQALVSKHAHLQDGAQVLKGAIVQCGAVIGEHSIINTGALIEHDTVIGEHNHIAPRAVLCGGIVTQSDVYVGANATVIQNLKLAQNVVVAAGAIVTCHLDAHQVCYPSRATIINSK